MVTDNTFKYHKLLFPEGHGSFPFTFVLGKTSFKKTSSVLVSVHFICPVYSPNVGGIEDRDIYKRHSKLGITTHNLILQKEVCCHVPRCLGWTRLSLCSYLPS